MKKIILSYDMEWANDQLLEWFNDILCEFDVKGTINVTHNTDMLRLFRDNKKIELGIHPNFNKLLDGEEKDDYKIIVKELKKIVPEAVSVRSHSLVSSNNISKVFRENGLTHESNMFINPGEGYKGEIFNDSFGLKQVPILFEDDLYLISENKHNATWYLDNVENNVVFNFHPIHLFLNTESMERYIDAKKYYHNFEKLKEHVNYSKNGIYNFYEELVTEAKARDYTFCTINELM